VAEASSGMKANSVWTPFPSGWKMETAFPCTVGKDAGLYICGVGCMKETIFGELSQDQKKMTN